jgi:hypothetical protein
MIEGITKQKNGSICSLSYQKTISCIVILYLLLDMIKSQSNIFGSSEAYTIEHVHVNGNLTILLRERITERISIHRVLPY